MTPAVADESASLARLARALSDPVRLRMLVALSESPAYPSDLADALKVSPSNMLDHLRHLRECGLVESVPGGVGSFVRLADLHLVTAVEELRNSAAFAVTTRNARSGDRPAGIADESVILAGSCG
ncbi:DNA-binding transcriptional regulator, ArsR family [Microlunatus soli]|uniref:DNA-binding transcriptional regulator, ArsR family n=2 Tax=Microlunatus soli TaxID=630515 RepID=A0A1H1TV81_9ACTN|nr:DNA-binding transcriptional regulator, ArsR family [Microlunatus soli]